MKPHIEETIRDLSSEIAKLNEMIAFLMRLEGGQPMDVRDKKTSLKERDQRTDDRAEIPLRAPADSGPDSGPRRKRNGQRTFDAASKLPQPFGADDLVQAAGISLCNANGYIHRWKIKGWIAPKAPGQYLRTADFGGVTMRNTALLEEIHAEIESKKAKGDEESAT